MDIDVVRKVLNRKGAKKGREGREEEHKKNRRE
jgi:hypothetical protein